MREAILSGTLGAALKRLPLMAAARKAFAEDLRRLHRVNPELARQIWLRSHATRPADRTLGLPIRG